MNRILPGILYLLTLIPFILFKSSDYLVIWVSIVVFLSIYEYFKCIDKSNSYLEYIGYIFATFLISLYVYKGAENWKTSSVVGYFYILFFVIIAVNVLRKQRYNIKDLSLTLIGYIYTIIFPMFILKLANLNNGMNLIMLMFSIAIFMDTFAYLTGKYFGKNKLSEVSGKKTIEGSIGGIICSASISILVIKILGIEAITAITIIKLVLFSIVAMVGDLLASLIKRSFDKKDFGKILGGHGGILDRVDSIILLAPIMYYFYSGLLV